MNSWLWVFIVEYLCSLGHVGHTKAHDSHIFPHMEDGPSWCWWLCGRGEECVCILLSTSVRRNVPSKHQTLGGGAHLYHSAFQTGGRMCPRLNGTPVPAGTLLL